MINSYHIPHEVHQFSQDGRLMAIFRPTKKRLLSHWLSFHGWTLNDYYGRFSLGGDMSESGWQILSHWEEFSTFCREYQKATGVKI